MADSNDLILLGLGILIGIGFATFFIVVNQRTQQIMPSYVEVPTSIRR